MPDVYVAEYMFTDGDKITELLPQKDIDHIRKVFADNVVKCAEALRCNMQSQNILATSVAFKTANNKPLRVFRELDNTYQEYPQHSVIFLGDCIMDILHSDRLIATKEYLKMLRDANKAEINIAYDKCEAYFANEKDRMCTVTIDFMENYKSN